MTGSHHRSPLNLHVDERMVELVERWPEVMTAQTVARGHICAIINSTAKPSIDGDSRLLDRRATTCRFTYLIEKP